ncbi:MAG: hypothetical protein DRP78_06415, partial [Candidatus Omnitrophota bacterium]
SVELDQQRLRAFNVSIVEVIDLIKQANLNYPAGTIETSFYEYLVRTMGEFKTVEEMDDLPLLIKEISMEEEIRQHKPRMTEEERERKKRVIYLRQLGKIKDTLKEQTSISRYNGFDNISLSVQRQADSNTRAISQRIYKKLDTLRRTLPRNLEIEVVYDQSVFIKNSIKELCNNALQGGVLAFIVLLIFLRNIRSAFVVTIGIPVSILFTFIFMFFNKLSLNMMSLGGLALGVGMLVDNGIVVIENIYRHKQMGKPVKKAAVEGSGEVFSSIVGSTLTTIAVFLPLIFVTGIAGQLFKQLALTVTFSLIASVVTAMALTPMFMSKGRLGKISGLKNLEKTVFAKFKQKGQGNAKSVVSYFTVILILVVTLIAAAVSFKLLLSLDKEFMPKMDQRRFMMNLEMPAGTNLHTTDMIAGKIENILVGCNLVKDVTLNIGSSKEIKAAGSVDMLGQNQAKIIVNLRPRTHSWLKELLHLKDKSIKMATTDFIQELKTKLESIDLKDLRIEYVIEGSIFKSVLAGSAPLTIVLKGFELEDILIPATKQIEKKLKDVEGIYGIKNTLSSAGPEVKVRIRKDRASLYQLTVNKIASTAQAAIKGYVATKYKEEGREIDIRVRLREQDRNDFNKIGKLIIFSPLGTYIFLEQVAYLAQGFGPTEIKREDKQRVVFITANLYKRALNDVVSDVNKIIDDVKEQLPRNYSIEIGGENKEMTNSFKDLRFALILSLMLVYMIMASEFESLMQPFIVMFTVPLSLIGVAWILFVSHTALSVVVFLGFIMLGGIVVNDGILLIDFINLARKNGLGIFESAIQAAKVRARPILMTSFTTIFGLLPLVLGLGEGAEFRAPMAKTVMGGLISATFLTLFVVPSLYIVLESLRVYFMTFLSRSKDAEEGGVVEKINISMQSPKETEFQKPLEKLGVDAGGFNQRQTDALNYVRNTGKITRLEYVVKFKVSLPLAIRELDELVNAQMLKAMGKGPQKIYTLLVKEEN